LVGLFGPATHRHVHKEEALLSRLSVRQLLVRDNNLRPLAMSLCLELVTASLLLVGLNKLRQDRLIAWLARSQMASGRQRLGYWPR
jgi:hypothetical protein